MIYLRGSDLLSVDLDSGLKRKLGSVPSRDVFPYDGRLAVIEDAGGGEDFAADPMLSIRNHDGSRVMDLGTGYSPLPGPDGSLAFLRPAGSRVCEGETCRGGVLVMVTRAPTEKPAPLLPPGDWGLLAWSGPNLIVADGARGGRALLVHEDGSTDPLPFAADEVWDAAGSLVVVVRDGVRSFDLETEETTEPWLTGGVLAEGSISGPEVLAVELRGDMSRLLHVSPADGEVVPIRGSKGAMGPVLWAEEGEAFSYVRADGLKLEAVVCEATDTCATVLRWAEGITPLALR